jgi:hypothetical protein
VPGADAEPAPYAFAARRVHDLGPAPGVLHDADVADPDAMGEPRAQRLDDRLFRGEAHREKAVDTLGFGELRTLGGQQQPRDEMLAVFLVDLPDPGGLEHVDADAEDHRRAPVMSAFMSRTARSRPVKIARAMMQWPMLSSTISGMAATGCTLS